MDTGLYISDTLELPLDAVTQTFAILAQKGVGKTYLALVMFEEMVKAGLPVVYLDPIGVGWGLRFDASGEGYGLDVAILGGEHGDIEISDSDGEKVANLVANEDLSLVIDLGLMRKGEQRRFVTAFAETLYHRNRRARHIILDEADAFAPQRPLPGQQVMLGAVEDLVRAPAEPAPVAYRRTGRSRQ
jgi:DNA helicase HerA-like ATPase